MPLSEAEQNELIARLQKAEADKQRAEAQNEAYRLAFQPRPADPAAEQNARITALEQTVAARDKTIGELVAKVNAPPPAPPPTPRNLNEAVKMEWDANVAERKQQQARHSATLSPEQAQSGLWNPAISFGLKGNR
jgi:hypothetical protein